MMGGGMPGMDMMGGGMPGMDMMGGGAKPEGNPKDIKFILCDTCKAVVKHGAEQVEKLRAKLPNTKITESRIDEMLEKVCEAKEEAGMWIVEYDIVENGDRLDLVHKSVQGQCQEECKTIEL